MNAKACAAPNGVFLGSTCVQAPTCLPVARWIHQSESPSSMFWLRLGECLKSPKGNSVIEQPGKPLAFVAMGTGD